MTNKTKETKQIERNGKMKKLFSILAIIITMASLTSTAFAATTPNEIETYGSSSVLCFKLAGEFVFCSDPKLLAPNTGMEYIEKQTTRDFSCLDELFVNMYTYAGTKDITFYKVCQQALWAKLDSSEDYRDNVTLFLGEKYVDLFDKMVAPAVTDKYVVTYTAYTTDNAKYQMMVSGNVETAKSIVETTTCAPETTTKIPETTTQVPKTTVKHIETTVITTTSRPTTTAAIKTLKTELSTQSEPQVSKVNSSTRASTIQVLTTTKKTEPPAPVVVSSPTVKVTTKPVTTSEVTEAEIDVLGYEVLAEIPATGNSATIPVLTSLAIATAIAFIIQKKK